MNSYVIDGMQFATLSEFFDVIEKVLIPNMEWGRNLDAFNDVLSGGFGTPDEGFELIWKNSEISQAKLGYAETHTYLRKALRRCHPANIEYIKKQIVDAQNDTGQTIYDWLIEIVRSHGPGGDQAEDNVILKFE
jgi:RNAse (barnase) inhibitor barstar